MGAPDPAGVILRVAGLQDSGFVWCWRNDPVTRHNSINPEPISWATHRNWYSDQLSDPDTQIFVLEDSIEGPLAQARYHRSDIGLAEVHVTVAPAARGKGLGTKLLKESAAQALESLNAVELTAIVMQDNPASVRAFEAAGYHIASESEVRGNKCFVFKYCHATARNPRRINTLRTAL